MSRSPTRRVFLMAVGFIIAGASLLPAAVDVNVQASPDPAQAGDLLRVSITVTNDGAGAENDLTVSLEYPANMFSLGEGLISGPYTSSCPGTSCETGETLVWDVGTLVAGQSVELSFPAFVVGTTVDDTIIEWEATVSNNGGDLATDVTTVVVDNTPALSLSIDASHDPVPSGGELVYTIRYGNRSADSVTGTELSFSIPGNASFVSATGNGTESGGVVTWSLATLQTGAVAQQRVVVAVDGGLTSGTLVDAGATISGTSNAAPTEQRATYVAHVGPTPALAFNLDVGPQPAQPGEAIRVELTVSNTTGAQVFGVQVDLRQPNDIFSVGEGLITGPYTSSCPGTSCEAGEILIWQLGTLNPGQSVSFSLPPFVIGTTASGIVVPWRATLTDDSATRVVESESLMIDSAPALSISIDESSDPIPFGDQFVYTLRYGNRSGDSVTGTELRFPIPAGTSLVSSTGGTESGGVVSWSLATLQTGGVGQQRVVVELDGGLSAGDLIESEAVIDGTSGAFPTAQRATSVAYVVPDSPALAVSLNVGPQPATPGQVLDAELTVNNTTGAQIFGVQIDLRYPEGIFSVAEGLISGPYNSSCPGTSCESREVLTWELGTLNPGESVAVSLPPFVNGTAASGLVIPWEATVSDDSGSRVVESQTLMIDSVPALAISIDEDQDPIPAEGELIYTLRYGNRSAESVTGSELRFPIPAGTSLISSTGGSESDGVVSWSLATLPAGVVGQQRVIVAVDDLPSGSIVESEAVIHGNGVAFPTSRRRTSVASVGPTPGLALSLNLSPQPATPGQRLDVELTVNNTTGAQIFGAEVNLRYPDGIFSVGEGLITGPYTSSCPGTSCESREILTWELGTLNPGQSVTFSLPPFVEGTEASGAVIPWSATLTDDSGVRLVESQTLMIDSIPALSIAIDESRDPIAAGDQLVYRLVYGNLSNASVTGTELRFPIPAGTALVSSSGGTESDGVLSWSLATLPVGVTGEQEVVVTVDGGLPAGAIIESEVVIDGISNPFRTERRATSAAYVAPSTPLDLLLEVSPSAALPSEELNVELTVVNVSGAQVFGARLAMRYPDGMFSVGEGRITGPYTSSCPGNSCESGEILIWDFGLLEPDAMVTVSLPPLVSGTTPRGTVIPWKAMATEDGASLRHDSQSLGVDEVLLTGFLRGDCNGDGKLDISDGVYNLNFLFSDGPNTDCLESCNTNNDDKNDISDAISSFNFLFADGPPPAAPHPDCGDDPEPEASLGCDSLRLCN